MLKFIKDINDQNALNCLAPRLPSLWTQEALASGSHARAPTPFPRGQWSRARASSSSRPVLRLQFSIFQLRLRQDASSTETPSALPVNEALSTGSGRMWALQPRQRLTPRKQWANTCQPCFSGLQLSSRKTASQQLIKCCIFHKLRLLRIVQMVESCALHHSFPPGSSGMSGEAGTPCTTATGLGSGPRASPRPPTPPSSSVTSLSVLKPPARPLPQSALSAGKRTSPRPSPGTLEQGVSRVSCWLPGRGRCSCQVRATPSSKGSTSGQTTLASLGFALLPTEQEKWCPFQGAALGIQKAEPAREPLRCSPRGQERPSRSSASAEGRAPALPAGPNTRGQPSRVGPWHPRLGTHLCLLCR